MKILAIEASGLVAGCALMETDGTQEGSILLGEYSLQHRKTHSQTLVPMMNELKQATGLDLMTLDAIAITEGPGSFTGLRIGAATAKGLALALDLPIIPVSTLEAMAANLYGTDQLICPLMDARRNQVYTAIYRGSDSSECVKEPCAVLVEDLIAELNDRGEAVILLGDGVPVYMEALKKGLKVPHSYAPAHLARQRAAATASAAIRRYQDMGRDCMVDPDDFRPEYLRKSQAEKQRDEAEKEGKMAALAAGNLVKEERAEGRPLSSNL